MGATGSLYRASNAEEHGRTHEPKVRKTKTYRCPHADKFGCDVTFTMAKNARTHGKRCKPKDPSRIAFPHADELGCNKIFGRGDTARKHGKTHEIEVPKTPQNPYPCPNTVEFGCDLVFETDEDLPEEVEDDDMSELAHAVVTEDEEAEDDMSEDVSDDCSQKHTVLCNIGRHIRPKALRRKALSPKRILAQLQSNSSATRSQAALSSAKMHKDFHFPPKHRCPYADSGCNKMFRSVSNATVHGEAILPPIYSCPHAEKQGCHQMFRTPEAAKKHGKATHGAKHPCPKAEAFNCNKMFTSISSANHHTVVHGARERRYCCPHADKRGPKRSF